MSKRCQKHFEQLARELSKKYSSNSSRTAKSNTRLTRSESEEQFYSVMATPEQIQQEKAARRAAIRTEYWRTITNPHAHLHGESGGVVSLWFLLFMPPMVCYVIESRRLPFKTKLT